MWHLQQRERKGSKQGASTNGEKGKGKQKKKEGKEKDMYKVKCWACQNMGHYAAMCPEKNNKGKGKTVAASAEVDDFAVEFEREFSFIAILFTTVTPSSILYVDSGVSCHMTSVREHFSEYNEKKPHLEVVLWDDHIVRAVSEGIVTFQRESLPPLKVTEVLYVPGLKKNLTSMCTIEDRGYEVTFRGG